MTIASDLWDFFHGTNSPCPNLIHTRQNWDSDWMDYGFTQDELDKAENREDGFIMQRFGLNCYVQKEED